MNNNLAYQADVREELVDGRLVAMSPAATNHNRIAGNIYGIFWNYLRGKPCVPFGDGEKVFLTDTEHYVPDFMIICDRSKIKPDGVHGAPDLVVEILSPSTGAKDKGQKKRVYAQCGVPEYWIISPEAKSIDIYFLEDGRYELQNSLSLYPDYLLAHMTSEEKDAIVTNFKCHLYDDLELSLNDIFHDLLP